MSGAWYLLSDTSGSTPAPPSRRFTPAGTSMLVLTLALAGCDRGPAVTIVSAPISTARPVALDETDAIARCERLLSDRLILEQPEDRLLWDCDEFVRIDAESVEFIKQAEHAPTVDPGCVRVLDYEARLEQALTHHDRAIQLQALCLLIYVRAPRSVAEQSAALQGLRAQSWPPRGRRVLDELQAAFSEQRVVRSVRIPRIDVWTAPDLWCLRAAGVLQIESLIADLQALTCTAPEAVAKTAAISLSEFAREHQGANQALAAAVAGWTSPAREVAAAALRQRDQHERLLDALGPVPPSEADWRYWLERARCRDPLAVAPLCRWIPELSHVDVEMFRMLGELGRSEDLPAVERLGKRIRPEQEKDYVRCRRSLIHRLGDPTPAPVVAVTDR